MKAYVNIADARDTMREMTRNLSAEQVARATARAINHTTAKAKTDSTRSITKRYNLGRAQVKLKQVRANQRKQYGMLNASTKPVPLISYKGTRQTKRGVKVQVLRGQTKTIKGAFITTTKKGRRGVFARGEHQGYEFKFRHKRIVKSGPDMPIEELYSTSIYASGVNDHVQNEIKPIATSQFQIRLAHELKNIASGITR